MKKFTLTPATILFIGLSAFAQDIADNKKWYLSNPAANNGASQELSFDVRGRYTHRVTREKLNDARFITDFVPGYPVNWISDYVSVNIAATCNGKSIKAVSVNDKLSADQKNILKTADEGTAIDVNVKYISKNATTGNSINNEMNISTMVVPEEEAEYVGGYQLLRRYLKENVINKISERNKWLFQDVNPTVQFTVNESGEIVNVKISKSSGHQQTDILLLDGIAKMPKWKPAKNRKGTGVKEEFEFSVGRAGC